MKNHSRQLRWLTGACGLAFVTTRLLAGTNASSTEAEIRAATVFYQPLVWVGGAAPSEEENRILASDLQNIKAHGLAGW